MAEEHLSRAKFIRLSAVLGVGTAGASMLASCGGGSGSGSGGAAPTQSEEPAKAPEGSTKEESSGAEVEQGTAIAKESDVAPGSAFPFKDSGKSAVLVHLESGDFVAYSAVCTHAGCEVAYNKGQLACPCHGSVFDPAKGAAVVSGPANRPLPEIPVEARDGQVFKA